MYIIFKVKWPISFLESHCTISDAGSEKILVSAPSRNLVPGIVVLEEALTLIPDIVFGGETDLHLGIVA